MGLCRIFSTKNRSTPNFFCRFTDWTWERAVGVQKYFRVPVSQELNFLNGNFVKFMRRFSLVGILDGPRQSLQILYSAKTSLSSIVILMFTWILEGPRQVLRFLFFSILWKLLIVARVFGYWFGLFSKGNFKFFNQSWPLLGCEL